VHNRGIDIADMVTAELVNLVRTHGVSPTKPARSKLWHRNVTRLSPANMDGNHIAYSACCHRMQSRALTWRA
jgi:hypothetical protein